MKRSFQIWCTLFSLLFVGLVIFQLTHGSIHLSWTDIRQVFSGHGSAQADLVLLQFRLPQIALSVICGVCLGLSGAILQLVTENPLADTSIMGINAGASLGAVVFLAISHLNIPLSQTVGLPIFAVLGSLVGACIVFIQRRLQQPLQLLLLGIASGTLLNGIILLIELQLDQFDFDKLIVWISGDFWNQDWSYIAVLGGALLILLPLTLRGLWASDILTLGQQAASGLGLAVAGKRQVLLLLAVLLAGLAVAGGGAISFVGLMAPHIARRLVGNHGRHYLPLTALIGVNLILFAAVVAENIFAPSQLPVGLVVAVITMPYFVYLLLHQADQESI
ncbi:FecCD family ABC transporter permease [Loigolactobacillus jiayinensis]|uniref:FecCD family ABC transporter permease n=1 Tax=Loigolactobacillus jiayinensis TaxID=2486016 RepID=A0ABW1RIF2_9LACO|nr:iron ABC transporter permease [Loigolactobacillus jiayinensis]